tara:strand:- start:22005 stop:22538 length:534 start_codon:yes stop_codon:yes gene_type:complete
MTKTLNEVSKNKLLGYIKNQIDTGDNADNHYDNARQSLNLSRKSERKSRNNRLSKSTRKRYDKSSRELEADSENETRKSNNRHGGTELAFKKLMSTKAAKYRNGKNPRVLAKEDYERIISEAYTKIKLKKSNGEPNASHFMYPGPDDTSNTDVKSKIKKQAKDERNRMIRSLRSKRK